MIIPNAKIANLEHTIKTCMLCLPSLVWIRTRDPNHNQSLTNDALDRSATVPGFQIYIVIEYNTTKQLWYCEP